MPVKTATFDRSFPDVNRMDNTPLPEFAFIGRSNVGKSSLINYLANQKNLAKVSSKPGKTRIINRFLMDKSWYLIDLPGYGFAKLSKRTRDQFDEMITGYLQKRKNLITAFVLIDLRHPPQSIDMEFIEWCGVSEVPFQLIFTKSDKVKKTEAQVNLELFKAAMFKQGWEDLPTSFITSSTKRQGGEEILSFIQDCFTT